MRLFIAVWPPPDVLDTVARLDRPDVPGLRWTTPDQWHVTLRFLGQCEVEEVERAWEGVAHSPVGRATMGPVTSRFGRRILHVPVDGTWASFTRRSADAQAPAGGASSNARDMAQWLRLLLADGQHDGRQLIDKAALQSAHVPAIVRSVDPTTGAAAFYGFGWNVDYREHGVEWSHAGAFSAGARTLVHLIPGEQLGVAILSNAFPTGVPEGIAATFFDLVFKGEPARDWVALANEVFEAGY